MTPQFLVGEWVARSQTTPAGLLESVAGMGFERSSRARLYGSSWAGQGGILKVATEAGVEVSVVQRIEAEAA